MKEKFEVQISRVHKSSPYNCSQYIHDVKGLSADDVFNSQRVQKLIDKTFGKNLTVIISAVNSCELHVWMVEKQRAII